MTVEPPTSLPVRGRTAPAVTLGQIFDELFGPCR